MSDSAFPEFHSAAPAWQVQITDRDTGNPISNRAFLPAILAQAGLGSRFEEIDAEFGLWLVAVNPGLEATLLNSITDGEGFDLTLGSQTALIHLEGDPA